jgi:uncharacterized protein
VTDHPFRSRLRGSLRSLLALTDHPFRSRLRGSLRSLLALTDVPQPASTAARVLSAPILAYRRWVGPGLPDLCRFHPSCSTYALTAIATHGPVRGVGLAVWRLLRCHPFARGGIDPVPPPRDRRPPADVTGAVTR